MAKGSTMKKSRGSRRRHPHLKYKQPLMASDISESDKDLIRELRARIGPELELVPSYNDDLSLLRWLVGWDRKVDVVVPKISVALKTIHVMDLDKKDFTSFEAIKTFCDNVSKPACYMPGSLIGRDRDGNVISLQAMGKIDGVGLLHATMISDLYVMRIAESEGVMQLIRDTEKKNDKQYGTTVIVDLDGIGLEQLDLTALKAMTGMLGKLQELFPDVLRKLYIIRAPSFIHMIWTMVYPCLAKQTQQKVEFLGSDWKNKLREAIDENLLYEEWGGTRKADSLSGDVRIAGKIPKELYYNAANDPVANSDQLKKLSVSARSMTFVPVDVVGDSPHRRLKWWWKCDKGDVEFGVRLAASNSPKKAEEEDDTLIWPKWRLLTEFVPESRSIAIPRGGTYKLVFDNCHGKLWSKNLRYHVEILE